MNKKTKMYIGVGVVAVAAYYFWKKSQESKTTATTPATTAAAKFVGSDGVFANQTGCPSGYTYSKNSNGVYVCDNGKGIRYRTNPIR
jgi:hypothetical protein